MPDDGILLRAIELKPRIAKIFFFAQDGAGRVAFEFFALGVFKIELDDATQTEQFFDLGEAAFAVVFERGYQCVALLQRQRLFLQSFTQDAQVVHLLVDAKPLCAG